METLPKGYTLEIPEGAFPLSTDSMVLGDFVRLPRQARVLDLGSGCGTLGLLLCAGNDSCHVTGLEITETAHRAALQNISRNGLQHRMESICGDLTQVSRLFKPGSFSVCISNPPYFSGGPASQKLTAARREELCSAEDLFSAASYALKFGGDFFLVHRPERLGELMALGDRAGMQCKRLRLLRHRQDDPIALVLLQLRKGAKPGLILEETALRDGNGQPTGDYKRIYHMEEA